MGVEQTGPESGDELAICSLLPRATRPQCGSAGVTSLTERCTLSTGGCKKKYIYTDHALVLVQEKVKRYTTERVFDT